MGGVLTNVLQYSSKHGVIVLLNLIVLEKQVGVNKGESWSKQRILTCHEQLIVEFVYLIMLVITGTFSYHTMTVAVRLGDISAIAPIRYTRLFFAMGLGALVFNEIPDNYTLLGAGIIVISGLYAFLRELHMNKSSLYSKS